MEHSHWVNFQQWMRKWNVLFLIMCACFCVSSIVCMGTNRNHGFSRLTDRYDLELWRPEIVTVSLQEQYALWTSELLPECTDEQWQPSLLCLSSSQHLKYQTNLHEHGGPCIWKARHQVHKMTIYPVQLKKLILGKVKLGKSDCSLAA